MKTLLTGWLALLLLFGLQIGAAYAPLGATILHLTLAVGISAIMAALVAILFMQLSLPAALPRIFSCAGIFWVLALFILGGADYLTRNNFFISK